MTEVRTDATDHLDLDDYPMVRKLPSFTERRAFSSQALSEGPPPRQEGAEISLCQLCGTAVWRSHDRTGDLPDICNGCFAQGSATRPIAEQEVAMTKTINANNATTRRDIVDDALPPRLRGRVKGLVQDLANDDLPMAVLDLAQLYRALKKGTKPRGRNGDQANWPDDRRTVVFNEDQSAVEEICMGPDDHGKCPWAHQGAPAACAGKWIMNKGWNFKVAPEASGCPLISLGVAHTYLRAAIDAGEKGA